jgi:Domain of unknown function (DUF5666)
MSATSTKANSPDRPGMASPEPAPYAVSRRVGILTLISGVLTLTGCGGDGGGGAGAAVDSAGIGPGGSSSAADTGDTSVAGVSSGGTGSTSVGSVTGFGSIYLNGNDVRIDDATATVTDEDGNDKKGTLKLGMRVTVTSTVATNGDVTAQSIVVGSELLGHIGGAPDANHKTFEVLGQTVLVVGGTVFDSAFPQGFASLQNNDLVEVHGLLNAKDNVITATFIEKKTSATYFKIQGLVSNLKTGPKEFRIKNLDIGFSNTPQAQLLVTPTNNAYVRVRLNPVLPISNVWQGNRISGPASAGQNGGQVEVEGRVTAFNSTTSFAVDGLPVQTNIATVFDAGLIGAAEVGRWVEVKGVMTSGILVATRVKLEDDGSLTTQEYRLTGSVSAVTPTGPATGSFLLRGYTVQYTDLGTAQNPFDQGTLANLIDGALVEMRGTAEAGVANTLVAGRIKFL